MRIALFHNLPPGGAKRVLFEHARHLRERGHDLDAYLPSTADESYLPLAPLCREVFSFDVPGVKDHFNQVLGNRLIHHPITRRIIGLDAYIRTAESMQTRKKILELNALNETYAAMAAAIDSQGYDLIYVHHCRFHLSPYLLRCLRTPSVYYSQDTLRHVHEWAVVEDPEYEATQRRFGHCKVRGRAITTSRQRLWQEQEKINSANIRSATLVLANSYYSREAILRTCGVDAHVCYLGVDFDFFCPDPTVARENVVLSVGSLTPTKRHEFIIEAIATIPEARRPRLRIVGYMTDASHFGGKELNPLAKKLLCLAEERAVELQLSPEVSDEILRDAYRQAAVLAFAPRLEPFGLVPLEAMACGTPVVGVREAGLRESILDGVTGILTDRNPEEFGAALDCVVADKRLAAEIGANGRDAVRSKWGWGHSTNALEHYLSQVVGRRSEQ